jgi:adenine-specific DNA-methyltransferase
MNNIYIGDNLVVLKDLVSKGNIKYKMIYIDPPYNTRTKKTYNDSCSYDEWEIFIKERLECAYKLLLKNGCIFISIDDNEMAHLRNICDDIFGNKNFVGTFITKQSQRSNAKHINVIHEYILCYAKDKKNLKPFKIKRIDTPDGLDFYNRIKSDVDKMIKSDGIESARKKVKSYINKISENYGIDWIKNYNCLDDAGNIYFPLDLSVPSKPREVNIPDIGLHLEPLKTRGWASDEMLIRLHNENRLVFRNKRPYAKKYLYEAEDNAPSILNYYSRQGTKDLKDLGMDGIFDTPKPVALLKYLLRLVIESEDRVLDFFGGSGSFGQAVIELNNEEQLNLEFDIIQLNESVDENTESYRICKKLGVEPTIDNILVYRLSKFYSINNLNKDFYVQRFV